MIESDSSLLSKLAEINDPRVERQKRHLLIDIFAITICAVICGANTWNEIAQYGEYLSSLTRKNFNRLSLTGWILCGSHFRRLSSLWMERH